MPVSGVDSINSAYTTDPASTIQDKSGLGIDDFFQLMAAQLQNQTMFDTVDNTQFITQMAQFSSLSQMTELVSTFKTSTSISLLGKHVNVMTSDEDGNAVFVSGPVQQVSFVNGTPMLYVEDGFYDLSLITDIAALASEETVQTSDTTQQSEISESTDAVDETTADSGEAYIT